MLSLTVVFIVSTTGSRTPIKVASPAVHRYPIDPLVPVRVSDHKDVQTGLWAGFINPCLAPYNATGDGVADDTEALQTAIDDAYAFRMSVELPSGKTFLLSRQLAFIQKNRSRAYGFQIVGGVGSIRPVLRLKDHSTISGNILLLFQLAPSGAVPGHSDSEHYNSRFRGIDVNLGFNPEVSGLSMSGAQMCSIEDVRISGAAFYAGIIELPGSGGFSANIAVVGGDYGIVESTFRPNPSVSGLLLQGQAKAGILVNVARGPLVVSGFHIESEQTPQPGYSAILLANQTASMDNAFNGEDGSVLLHGDAVAIQSEGSDFVLKNVYVSSSTTVVSCPHQKLTISSPASPSGWSRVAHFVFSASGGSVWDNGQPKSTPGTPTAYPPNPVTTADAPPGDLVTRHAWIYDNIPTWATVGILNVCDDYGATPQWVNASDDDGAKIQQAISDACNASSPKFGLPIFLPHGEFGLYEPLNLLGCAQIFGSGTHSTTLKSIAPGGGCWSDGRAQRCSAMPVNEDLTGNDLLGSDGKPQPQKCETPALCCMMCTSHDPAASPFGHCGAWSWNNQSKTCWMKTGTSRNPNRKSHDVSGVVNPGAMLTSTHPIGLLGAAPSKQMLITDFSLYTQTECPFIDLSAGLDVLLRDVGISLSGPLVPPPSKPVQAPAFANPPVLPRAPYVSLRGTVNGKFYGLPLDGIFGGTNSGLGGPLHVLILVSGTGAGGAIHFYQASTEHLAHDPQVLITDSHDVHFHAWKYESSLNSGSSIPPDGSGSLVRIAYSQNVTSFGASGNYHMYNTTVPVIDVLSSRQLRIQGMVRKAAWNEPPGTVWLRDNDNGVSRPGNEALLLYSTQALP